ncbi:MAG: hypothetical protein U1E34_01655 [Amaricoccus sp.]
MQKISKRTILTSVIIAFLSGNVVSQDLSLLGQLLGNALISDPEGDLADSNTSLSEANSVLIGTLSNIAQATKSGAQLYILDTKFSAELAVARDGYRSALQSFEAKQLKGGSIEGSLSSTAIDNLRRIGVNELSRRELAEYIYEKANQLSLVLDSLAKGKGQPADYGNAYSAAAMLAVLLAIFYDIPGISDDRPDRG